MSDTDSYFIALYSGRTVGEAQIVAASSDRDLVTIAAATMLREKVGDCSQTAAARALDRGRREALRLIAGSDRRARPARRGGGKRLPSTEGGAA